MIDLGDAPWYVKNDAVMGGLSKGRVEQAGHKLIFFGDISIENNGGFTSTFKPITPLPKAISNIKVCLKGDGNDYQLRLKSHVMAFPLAYKVMLATPAGQSLCYQFKLADFKATHRGRAIDTAPALLASTITEVGFLIANKQPNTFALEVFTIEFS